MQKNEYIKIGNAQDFKVKGDKKNYRLYRFFEILPGVLAWGTLIGVVFLSWAVPVFVAFFIIAFDIYWLLKTLFLGLHLRAGYSKMQVVLKTDWLEELKKQRCADIDWQDLYHLVVFPMYQESYEVVAGTIASLANSNYPKDRIIAVLSVEDRAGEESRRTGEKIVAEFGDKFFKFSLLFHPDGIVGELAGKGSNQTWAVKKVKENIIDSLKIPYENILVSVFDVDTVIFKDYLARLTSVFLEAQDRVHCSFQPIPVFNNNIWDAPSFSRVVAQSGTFWHMMQQERSERLATFSSHSMNFKSLVEMNFWSIKNVSEDSRIFWQSLLFYDGKYRAIPLYYPVSMDANLGKNIWQTMVNVYKQQRRWGWGVENIPYLLFGFSQNKEISFRKKVFWIFNHMEGFWSWATNAILIFMLGWLPLFLGGTKFNISLLSYNLPQVTRVIMTLAMVGLVSSAVYGIMLLPIKPKKRGRFNYVFMVIQWILMPVTIIFFGSIPGLEAQTRLMFGKYMGFWVTPKGRGSL